jgi:protease-4
MASSFRDTARRLWNTLDTIRRFLTNMLFLGLVALLLVGLLWRGKGPEIPPNSVLVLDLVGALVEETAPQNPLKPLLARSLGLRQVRTATRVADVIRVLRAASKDPRIALIALRLEELTEADLPKLHALAQEVRLLGKMGKPVWVHDMVYTQPHYLLAAACQRVSLHPLGGVILPGFGYYPLHIKKLLDTLRIDIHVVRAGSFKSAPEPLIQEAMSEETRASIRPLLDSLWRLYREDIAASRKIPAEALHTYANTLDRLLIGAQGDAANLAKTFGLVDAIESRETFRAALAEHLKIPEDKLSEIPWEDYAATLPPPPSPKDAIAVIRAQGPILPTSQGVDTIGADELTQRLKEAATDPRTRALVLRLDSPGGSAAASEEIRETLERIRNQGIPVVVSMGSVGASGAYWIATAATRILAEPMTITGSIGVFATIPNFHRAAQALGINSDGVGVTDMADQTNPLRPFSPRAQEAMRASVDFTYRRFQSLVAQSRGLDASKVARLAQGQVWTGEDARREQLVDAIGTTDLAVTIAASLAGVPDAAAVEFPPQSTATDLWKVLLPKAASRSVLSGQEALLRLFLDPTVLALSPVVGLAEYARP